MCYYCIDFIFYFCGNVKFTVLTIFKYKVQEYYLYSHYYTADLQNFSSCIMGTLNPPNTNSPLSLQPLVITFLLSVSMILTTLDTPHKWNHTVFVVL